jgi:branched-chain amino acid transport system substrate-binding protein
MRMSVGSRVLMLLLGGVALVATGACVGSGEPVIGAVLPFSGRGASYGESVKKGIDLGIEEVNAAGGIDGQPVKVIYEDTGTDPEKGKAAARKLIEQDGVPAIIGAVASSVTLAILEEVTGPARVPLLSPASSSPSLSGKSPYFQRVYPSDTLEGARMADLASEELRLKTLVVFAVADEYGNGYQNAFGERYRRHKNREILKVISFPADARDFTAMVEETKGLAPEGVFIIGYQAAVVDLVRALRGAAINVPLLASGSLTSTFPVQAGAAAEGLIFSRASVRHIGNQEKVKAFIAAYKAKYGEEPEDYAAYGYDAFQVLVQVMRAGHRDIRDIQLALRTPSATYEGVTGNIVFGREGDVVASPTTFIVSSGAIVPYKDYLDQGGLPPGAAPARPGAADGGKR